MLATINNRENKKNKHNKKLYPPMVVSFVVFYGLLMRC